MYCAFWAEASDRKESTFWALTFQADFLVSYSLSHERDGTALLPVSAKVLPVRTIYTAAHNNFI